MLLNAENFSISLDLCKDLKNLDVNSLTETEWDNLTGYSIPQKPLYKTHMLADAVKDIDPDILILSEIIGHETCLYFNNYFLEKKYAAYFNETNSNRGIDFCILVKNKLELVPQLGNHRKRKIMLPDGHKTYFSRDIAELKLLDPKTNELKMIVLAVHLKSQLSSERDWWGQNIREAEVKSLTGLYQELSLKHPKTDIAVVGDFNGNASLKDHTFEFNSIFRHTDLMDIHDLKNSSTDERSSFVFFQDGVPLNKQLDYIFLNPSLCKKIVLEDTYSYRYKFFGVSWPLVNSMNQKMTLPSDHYPQVVKFILD